ncbi:MAG: hypothetical protein ACJAVK_000674 [Akkermansiaceae bacterium]|jgi:hypothetical protein
MKSSLHPSSDADSRHPYGSQVCPKARLMFRYLILAMTVAGPCEKLLAANPDPIDLGTAANFGALSGGAISGSGNVKGDVGSGSGAISTAVTSTGIIYPAGDAVTMTALTDFATAYNDGKNRTPDVLLSAAAYELGGTTITSGVHKIGAAATLGSPVTLNAQGDPDAVFIIQIGAAFSATASVGNVILTNNAQSSKVFWIVEGAVSMGASIHMEGNILGNTAITFGASTTINGRLLASEVGGTIAMATTISVPVDPSVVGNRVWFDASIDGIQDSSETTGFSEVPVSLLQRVLEKTTLDLGNAANYGALAGGAISGSGNVAGNVGSGSGAIAPAITSDGTIYATGDAATMTALDDFATAYTNGKNRTPDVLLSAAAYELGGATLTPGVYKIGAAATLASPVTLDAQGDPEAVFIIQIVGAFGTTASAGDVILTNEAKSANIFWIVEGAVSLGAGTNMKGNILGGAAITFGATTTISGRSMAGSAAGTIVLSTTVSAVTGTPPVGFPPPTVVAHTVTDVNGDYLFEGVQPGIHIVRWDLTNVTTDYRITAAKQGGDDALDSDSASGEVSGFVYSTEIVVLGGSTHLGVDLGLVETLPAIKAAAVDELATALVTYLLANYYTAENWTEMHTAKTDGEIAIHAATNPAGVAAAKATALAAMAAVPIVAETLAEAKVVSLADMATAMGTYLQASYTTENWTTLTTAKTNGDTAINVAPDLVGVATVKASALAAMDAVPTIAETLAAAKVVALADFETALATYLEANYTSESWTVLQNSVTNDQIAIKAAIDLAGLTTAKNSALDALEAVPTFTETMVVAKAGALNDLTTALATYLEANYYTYENWTALIMARTAGNIAINAAIDPAGVATAREAALAAMNALPTYTETLAAAKAPALADLATALMTYLEANYTAENWTALNTARTNGDRAINAATDPAGVATVRDAALAALDAVPTIAETLAAAKEAALADLARALATYLEANYYNAENWALLQTAKTNGNIAINAATDPLGVATARDAALASLDAVPSGAETLMIAEISGTSEGEVTLVLRTTPNFPLTLQTSTDLKSWTTIATATPVTDLWRFVHDATLATGPRRFYRAFLNP